MAGTLPPTLRRLRPACLAIAAGCLLGLAACDGYPSEDQPLVDVFSLNSVERLQRLNQLGQSASAVDRWRYSVAGDCELAVGMRSKGTGWEHRQIGLRKQNFKLAYSADKASFDVRADAHADPQAGVHLFSGKDRGTALEVTLLVKLLARDCQAGAEDPGVETI
jgi:hypothetical protein